MSLTDLANATNSAVAGMERLASAAEEAARAVGSTSTKFEAVAKSVETLRDPFAAFEAILRKFPNLMGGTQEKMDSLLKSLKAGTITVNEARDAFGALFSKIIGGAMADMGSGKLTGGISGLQELLQQMERMLYELSKRRP